MGLATPQKASNVFLAEVPANYTDDFHPPPQRFLVALIKGEFETTVSDGSVRRFSPGNVALLDDLDSKGHKSVGNGRTDVLMMFVGLAE